MDITKFNEACNYIVGEKRDRKAIGTYKEKTLHAVLKHYYEPNPKYHEIPAGSYIADIIRPSEKNSSFDIIEIQTGNFNTLRQKLNVFLKENRVILVYPVAGSKWLSWINEETGEITKRRKSPKTGNVFDSFKELYKIKSILTNENLIIHIVIIEMEEFRLLNGWSNDKKKGSSRFDRIPLNLEKEIIFDTAKTFADIIPGNLPNEFTSSELSKAAKIPLSLAQKTLNILTYVGAVEKIGKEGRKILYSQKLSFD